MHAESLIRVDYIVVENAKSTEMHILRVMVIREGKEMLAREPGVICCIAVFGGDDLDVHKRIVTRQL